MRRKEETAQDFCEEDAVRFKLLNGFICLQSFAGPRSWPHDWCKLDWELGHFKVKRGSHTLPVRPEDVFLGEVPLLYKLFVVLCFPVDLPLGITLGWCDVRVPYMRWRYPLRLQLQFAIGGAPLVPIVSNLHHRSTDCSSIVFPSTEYPRAAAFH